MSNVAYANATIAHLRKLGVRMPPTDWHVLCVWLEKSADELEAWARQQALEEAARIAEGCMELELSVSPRFVADRIRGTAKGAT
jgi:hypothetical protein